MIKEYQDSRKPDKVVRHEIVDARDEVKLARDIAVMENFQLKVEMLKSEYPDFADKLDEEINDPQDYELWKSKLEEMYTRKKPKGQAILESENQKGVATVYEAENEGELINKLYDQLEELMFKRDMGRSYDAEKLKRLEAMRSKLLSSVLTGEKARGVTKRWYIWNCPQCSKPVANSMTCSCGYVNKSPSSVKGRVDFV